MTKRKCEITLVPISFITKMGENKGGEEWEETGFNFQSQS